MIGKFIEQVAPPGEKLRGFDDRLAYDDAIEYAKIQNSQGWENAGVLLEKLQAMAQLPKGAKEIQEI
jgi:hypothetical protein